MTLSSDDLIAISLQVNALQYIVQDLQEGFFETFNSEDEKDRPKIIWEFNRNRARTYIISEGLYQVEQILSQLGANR